MAETVGGKYRRRWWKLLAGPLAVATDTGSFDCVSAPLSGALTSLRMTGVRSFVSGRFSFPE
ncbi:hypothetical protein SBA1_460031 [Candidatus Sulfotelmatobacter kueseliae]|uniref:Uncharacterized protein n=1 Tax=Candidatus Sulfotelmatobacter kueseliae TaxID=2042962 RepID=A0A2U3KS11_9BACT|nr:hypothetical protein SBA1_460031 [Candidatus Sulfotelmatobacter kueseliae]